MEIEFYRIPGWQKDMWFTNVNGAVLCDWAIENEITYLIECHLPGCIGIVVPEKERILFELRWGNNYKGK